MRDSHDICCPREPNTMIRPQDCIYCEVIEKARQDEKDNLDFDLKIRGWR